MLLAQFRMPPGVAIAIAVVIVIFLLIFFAMFAQFISLWIQCKMTGARISFPHLIMMYIRRVNPTDIVRSKIMAVQAGLTDETGITSKTLEDVVNEGVKNRHSSFADTSLRMNLFQHLVDVG